MTVTSRQKTPFKVTSQNWGEDQNPETPCGSQKKQCFGPGLFSFGAAIRRKQLIRAAFKEPLEPPIHVILVWRPCLAAHIRPDGPMFAL